VKDVVALMPAQAEVSRFFSIVEEYDTDSDQLGEEGSVAKPP
jgi:hypothetical protein